MRYPRISIVTPSYNQAKYLAETIESVLNQNYPNLEYIIVDGGSTDGTVDIVKRYASHLAYWVSENDSGQSEAINKGFKKATSELFNWINSDDILFPGALERIAQAYVQYPEADLIVGCQARSDSEGRIFSVSVPPCHFAIRPEHLVLPIGQQATFISSNTFRRLGGVREDLHCIMDTELYYRILTAGGRFVRAKGLVGMIREHPAAKGIARSEEWDGERTSVFQQYRISKSLRQLAILRMRACRILDGSYLQSFLLLQRWKGKRAWDEKDR